MNFNPEDSITKYNEDIAKKAKIFNEKFPSIKFPPEFKVIKDDPLPHFMVIKEGAPNKVSVIVFTGDGSNDNRPPQWEIMAKDLNDRYLKGDSQQHVDIDDNEGLIKAIEQSFYYEEADIKPISNHDDEELSDDE